MRLLLLTLALAICLPASAATVYFDDGRICTGCKVQQRGGIVSRVTDSHGDDWEVTVGQRIYVEKHPMLKRMAEANQQMRQQSQQNRPIHTNCNSSSAGFSITTNCTSY